MRPNNQLKRVAIKRNRIIKDIIESKNKRYKGTKTK